jgi:hypothetical protein
LHFRFCIHFFNLFLSCFFTGKKIFQSDIAQYTGMAKEQNDFRATDNAESLLDKPAMECQLISYAKYPYDYIGVDR